MMVQTQVQSALFRWRALTPKQKATFFALVLGFLGLHRFYLHQWFRGAGYLLFFWTGFPLFLALIDAIFWSRLSEDEFEEEVGDFTPTH